MKTNTRTKVQLLLILFGLLALGLFALLFPQKDFSMQERRYLASAPQNFSLTQWTLKDDLETYLSDRLPFRSALIAVNSTYDLALARRVQLDVWPVKGMLIEKPIEADETQVKRRMDQLSALLEEWQLSGQALLVPSAGAVLSPHMPGHLSALYQDERTVHETISRFAMAIPLPKLLASVPRETYFSTDHHWTLDGAYLAYEAYCTSNGLTPFPLSHFILSGNSQFLGSTLSRSGLPFWKKDTLRWAQPQGVTFHVEGADTSPYNTLIFEENLQSWDPYTVFMNGNHGMAVVENPNAPQGHLVVFKDSFANTLLPLLSAHYSRITLLDLRYFGSTASEAMARLESPDQLLFCYSLDSLLHDTAVQRKLR